MKIWCEKHNIPLGNTPHLERVDVENGIWKVCIDDMYCPVDIVDCKRYWKISQEVETRHVYENTEPVYYSSENKVAGYKVIE